MPPPPAMRRASTGVIHVELAPENSVVRFLLEMALRQPTTDDVADEQMRLLRAASQRRQFAYEAIGPRAAARMGVGLDAAGKFTRPQAVETRLESLTLGVSVATAPAAAAASSTATSVSPHTPLRASLPPRGRSASSPRIVSPRTLEVATSLASADVSPRVLQLDEAFASHSFAAIQRSPLLLRHIRPMATASLSPADIAHFPRATQESLARSSLLAPAASSTSAALSSSETTTAGADPRFDLSVVRLPFVAITHTAEKALTTAAIAAGAIQPVLAASPSGVSGMAEAAGPFGRTPGAAGSPSRASAAARSETRGSPPSASSEEDGEQAINKTVEEALTRAEAEAEAVIAADFAQAHASSPRPAPGGAASHTASTGVLKPFTSFLVPSYPKPRGEGGAAGVRGGSSLATADSLAHAVEHAMNQAHASGTSLPATTASVAAAKAAATATATAVGGRRGSTGPAPFSVVAVLPEASNPSHLAAAVQGVTLLNRPEGASAILRQVTQSVTSLAASLSSCSSLADEQARHTRASVSRRGRRNPESGRSLHHEGLPDPDRVHEDGTGAAHRHHSGRSRRQRRARGSGRRSRRAKLWDDGYAAHGASGSIPPSIAEEDGDNHPPHPSHLAASGRRSLDAPRSGRDPAATESADTRSAGALREAAVSLLAQPTLLSGSAGAGAVTEPIVTHLREHHDAHGTVHQAISSGGYVASGLTSRQPEAVRRRREESIRQHSYTNPRSIVSASAADMGDVARFMPPPLPREYDPHRLTTDEFGGLVDSLSAEARDRQRERQRQWRHQPHQPRGPDHPAFAGVDSPGAPAILLDKVLLAPTLWPRAQQRQLVHEVVFQETGARLSSRAGRAAPRRHVPRSGFGAVPLDVSAEEERMLEAEDEEEERELRGRAVELVGRGAAMARHDSRTQESEEDESEGEGGRGDEDDEDGEDSWEDEYSDDDDDDDYDDEVDDDVGSDEEDVDDDKGRGAGSHSDGRRARAPRSPQQELAAVMKAEVEGNRGSFVVAEGLVAEEDAGSPASVRSGLGSFREWPPAPLTPTRASHSGSALGTAHASPNRSRRTIALVASTGSSLTAAGSAPPDPTEPRPWAELRPTPQSSLGLSSSASLHPLPSARRSPGKIPASTAPSTHVRFGSAPGPGAGEAGGATTSGPRLPAVASWDAFPPPADDSDPKGVPGRRGDDDESVVAVRGVRSRASDLDDVSTRIPTPPHGSQASLDETHAEKRAAPNQSTSSPLRPSPRFPGARPRLPSPYRAIIELPRTGRTTTVSSPQRSDGGDDGTEGRDGAMRGTPGRGTPGTPSPHRVPRPPRSPRLPARLQQQRRSILHASFLASHSAPESTNPMGVGAARGDGGWADGGEDEGRKEGGKGDDADAVEDEEVHWSDDEAPAPPLQKRYV